MSRPRRGHVREAAVNKEGQALIFVMLVYKVSNLQILLLGSSLPAHLGPHLSLSGPQLAFLCNGGYQP